MLMRRLLVSTMICSGLLAASGAFAATTPQIFQPNTNWAVSKVEPRQSGGGEYCALARRFTGDMILTFARNAKDESSVAIDFQKDLLQTGNTYYVTLKPGFGQDRMFEVKPVSGKAMVIRLGQDYAFYDAMARAGGLDVDISGQLYQFKISDMVQGQSQMNGCLAALMQPAAGESGVAAGQDVAPPAGRADHLLGRDVRAEQILAQPTSSAPEMAPMPAPAQAAAPQVVYQPDPSTLAQVESLREENMRLKNAMERERRSFEERFMQQGSESSKAVELNEKIRLLEMENESLRTNLSTAATLPKPPPVTNEMMDRVKLLETENAGLKKALADTATQVAAVPAPLQCNTANSTGTEQAQAMNAALQKELAGLRDENGRLKMQMADQTARIGALEQTASTAMTKAESAVRADSGAAMSQMQQRVAQLEEENAILRTKVKTQAVDAQPGEGIITLTQLRSVESQMQVIAADRDRLAKQIDDIQKGKGGDLLAKAAGNWDLEEATRRFNEAEREIRRLGGQLEQERSKCAADVKKVEYMMFDPAIATKEQTAKLMQLEEQVMSFNARTEVESASYKSRIKTLEKNVSDKDEQLGKVQQQIAAVEGKLQSKDAEIVESRKKIVTLEQTIASNSSGSAETVQKLAALEKDIAAKDGEIRTLRDNLGGLQQKYASLQQDAVGKDSRLRVTEDQLAAAKQTVDALQAQTSTQIAQAQALSEKQKAELASVQAQLAALPAQREELRKAQAEIAALSAQKAELTQAQQQKLAQLTAEKNALEANAAKVAQLEADKRALLSETAKVAQLEADKRALMSETAKIAQLEADKRSLQSEAAKIAQLEAEKRALQTENAKVAQLEAEKALLQADAAKLAQVQAEKVALEQQIATLSAGQAGQAANQEEVSKLVRERASLEARVALLETENGHLERSLAAVQPASGAYVAANGSTKPQLGAEEILGVSSGASRVIPRDSVMAETLPAPIVPPVMNAPATFAPAVTAATEGRRLMDAGAVAKLLQQAGINAQGGVQIVKDEPSLVAFTWDTGDMFGSAEQQPMNNPAQFDSLVQAYLKKTGERCGGEFGAIPGSVEDRDGARVATYEIACVAPDGGASAAMVFLSRDGLFTAVAHETGMDGMDLAMDSRDAIYSSLLQTRLASR